MKILRKYIIRELIGPTFLSLIVLTFVMFTARLLKLTDLVVNKGVSLILVGKLFGGMILFLLGYTVPMSVLTSVLLVFGKMSADNEIAAMRAGGISIYKIMYPVLFLSFIISLFSIVLHDGIIPHARFNMKKIIAEIGYKQPLAYLEAGTFINSFSNYILFFRDIEKNRVKDIVIYEPQENKSSTRVIMAQEGEFVLGEKKDSFKLRLYDGSIDEPDSSKKASSYRLDFKVYETDLDFKGETKGIIEKRIYHMTHRELRHKMKELKNIDEKIDLAPIIIEINKRFSLSFSTFVLILVGLPLAIKTRKSEKSVSFALSLGIVILYYVFFAGGEALSQKGLIPVWIGTWIPNFIFMLLGGILVLRVSRK